MFLGDVGRPDLAQKGANMTRKSWQVFLYDSLYHKILPLQDDITVYPAHGAGSACGKKYAERNRRYIGKSKRTNYALNQKDKQSFIQEVTDGFCLRQLISE